MSKGVKIGPLVVEGKTKSVFEDLNDPKKVIVVFRNDITADDGKKHEQMKGKNVIDCETNNNIFNLLIRHSIPTHYLGKISDVAFSDTAFLAEKLDYKFPIEVITRRVAYGSILKRRPDMVAGYHFKELCTEFSYKDDELHDPFIADEWIRVNDPKSYFEIMKTLNEKVFIVLENAFRKLGYQLIDFKLEYGRIDEWIIVIDEITAGSMRLWPFRVEELDFSLDNLMSQLDPKRMKDKELFRQGKDMTVVKEGFEVIADLTKQF